jgi:hypothetical protein
MFSNRILASAAKKVPEIEVLRVVAFSGVFLVLFDVVQHHHHNQFVKSLMSF